VNPSFLYLTCKLYVLKARKPVFLIEFVIVAPVWNYVRKSKSKVVPVLNYLSTTPVRRMQERINRSTFS
jgi:hypothetical protein